MDKLSPEEKEIGRNNYYDAVLGYNQLGPDMTRRNFLQRVVGASAVSTAGLGAMYFGYGKPTGSPVRIGIIGTGDEGNVLIGALNPEYVQVMGIADIRPSSIHRAFHGDWSSPPALAARPGLLAKYGWKTEDEARKHVKVYTEDYRDLLKDKEIEGVIIALPLHLHAKCSIQAMMAGKHVLTEKLMAHNVAQCKVMGRVATEQKKHLATGHQRHYSILYDNAVKLIQWGVLGELHHIRAQWHRGNLPGRDSWAMPLPGGERVWGSKEKRNQIRKELDRYKEELKNEKNPTATDLLQKKIAQWTAWDADKEVKAEDFGYITDAEILGNGEIRTALEELVRWRIWDRTGGGLMAELGSHQLDAASIFISAMKDKKVHPLTVHAVGGRHIFPRDRDAEDHCYCLFEFPGPGYDAKFDVGYKDPITQVPHPKEGVPSHDKDENKKIVVMYSSINGNGFGGYGEVVMGTKGTLIIEREQEVMLYAGSSTSTRVGVRADGPGGPTLDTQASGDAAKAKAAESEPVSRGYAEEIEHWAYGIRNVNPLETDPKQLLRCRPEVALGDAVIALTSRAAIRRNNDGKSGYLEFKEDWFKIDSDETPDDSQVSAEEKKLRE